MKIATVASIVISLYLSGAAQSRIQVEPIVPKLSHREYTVLNNADETISVRSLVEIPGVEVAKQFVVTKFGYIDGKDFVVKNTYTSDNGVIHTYLKQLYQGKEVVNGDLNINVDKSGKVISYGNSFYNSKEPPESSLLPDNFGNSVDAFDTLFKHIKIDSGVEKSSIVVTEGRSADEPALLTNIPKVPKGVKAEKKYIQTATGQLEPVWDLEADLDENWINAFVTPSNKVVGLHDWVHEASYNVIPIGTNDPEDGGRKVITQQGSATSSPLGWHDQGSDDQGKDRKFTTTTGNNVIAYDARNPDLEWTEAPRAEGGADLNFNFPVDFTKAPSTYVNAAITNLFYVSNMLHDIYYAHGFNEVAGNFQQNNFDKGGKGGDPVLVQAQDGSSTNNANFVTPPDGQQPRMRMYIFTTTKPNRDGDLDNGIIIHEYTHGLSSRLIGGSDNSNCLSDGEAEGMGEGWGDVMAYVFRTRAEHTRNTDFGIGNYLLNGNTARQKPYSTKISINPDTYASLNSYRGEYPIGAVWAEILYEVYWNLIDKLGFDADLLSGSHSKGNTLFLRLLIDSLKLQPCHTTFLHSRDAFFTADQQLTGGVNKCEIWKGFAKRGLGEDANSDGRYKDGHQVPQGC